jgi:hypothetical protein
MIFYPLIKVSGLYLPTVMSEKAKARHQAGSRSKY